MTQPVPTVYTDEHGKYCLIPLTQGQFVKVDPRDFHRLSRWKWHAIWAPNTKSFYASRKVFTGLDHPRKRPQGMHRQIKGNPSVKVDHANRDTLDNRRDNLRKASDEENARNRKMPITNTSGYKGVSPDRNKWRATLHVKGKKISFGFFDTKEEAHAVVVKKRAEFHGAFTSH
jgi:hypothetical protein